MHDGRRTVERAPADVELRLEAAEPALEVGLLLQVRVELPHHGLPEHAGLRGGGPSLLMHEMRREDVLGDQHMAHGR